MDLNNFQWTTKTQYDVLENGINIFAPAGSNFFVNPSDDYIVTNAPFFYTEVEGNFVMKARVNHDFISTYDANVLLAYDNDKLWAKACFEYTDLDTHSVVSVMTNEKSDDANGVDIDGNEVWLQIARKDNIFAIHYSLDGNKFYMSRICYLPMQKKIKVGLVAQSPLGQGAMMKFKDVSLELRTLENIRGGNE